MKTKVVRSIYSLENGVAYVNKYSHSVLLSFFIFFYIIISSIYVEQFFGVSLSVGGVKFRGIELILFVLGWSICLIHLFAKRNGSIVFPIHQLPLLLLIVWSVFRLLGTPDIQLGIRASMQFTLFFLVLLVFSNMYLSERKFDKILNLLFFVMFVQLFVAVYQVFNPVNAESAYSDIKWSGILQSIIICIILSICFTGFEKMVDWLWYGYCLYPAITD